VPLSHWSHSPLSIKKKLRLNWQKCVENSWRM
jgi:hypothetical protein